MENSGSTCNDVLALAVLMPEARDSTTTGVELRTPAAVPPDRANGCPGLRLPGKPAAAAVAPETTRAAAAAACTSESQTPVVVDHVRDEGCPRPHLPRKPAGAHGSASADVSANLPASGRRSRRRRRPRHRCLPTADASVAATARRNRRQRRRSLTWRIVAAGAGPSGSTSTSPMNGDVPLPPRTGPSPDGMPSAGGENALRGGAGLRDTRPGTDAFGFRSPPDPSHPQTRTPRSRRRCRKPTRRSRAWRAMPPDERGPGFLARAELRPPRRRRNRRRKRRNDGLRCHACGTVIPTGEDGGRRCNRTEFRRNDRWQDDESGGESPSAEEQISPVDAMELVRAYDHTDADDWAKSSEDEEDATAGLAELRGELAAVDDEWAVDDTASKSDECGRATRGQVAEPGLDGDGTDSRAGLRSAQRCTHAATLVALLNESADNLVARRHDWARLCGPLLEDDGDKGFLALAEQLDRVIDGLEDVLDAARSETEMADEQERILAD